MSTSSTIVPGQGLTVAVVSHDDQELLIETLDSVRAIADEIVVVECGAVARTAGMLARFGARIIPWEWIDDFSQARNIALDRARGAWALMIQPGERLDAASADAIRDYVAGRAADQALLVAIHVPPADPRASGEEICEPRLFPVRRDLRYVGRAAETIRPALVAAGVPIEISPWRIERGQREHDAELRRSRAELQLKLIEQDLREQPDSPRLLVAMGDLLAGFQQNASAAQRFRRAVDVATPGSTEHLAAYYGLLTTFPDTPAALDQQIAACFKALETYPFDAQLLCAMGGYLVAKGQIEVACRSYQAAYNLGQIDPETWHVDNATELAAVCLFLCRLTLGQDDQARQIAEETLARKPESHRLRQHLIHLHVKHARAAEALAEVDRLPRNMPCREGLRSAVRGACQAARANWIPALAYLETAHAAGCRDPLCLRWYAITLMATGNAAQAQAILDQWRAVEPDNRELAQYQTALSAGQPLPTPQHPLQVAAGAMRGVTAGSIPAPPQVGSPDLWTKLPASKHAAAVAEATSGGDDVRSLRIDSAKAPWDAGVHIQLGEAYQQAGDEQAAEAVWRDYLRRYPQSTQVIQALCELLVRTAQVDEAIALAERINQPAPAQQPFLHFMAGVAAVKASRWEQAAEQFAAARQMGYSHPVLLEHHSVCLTRLGRFEEAQALLAELSRERISRPRPKAHGPKASTWAANQASVD